jgi:hypothetical protein
LDFCIRLVDVNLQTFPQIQIVAGGRLAGTVKVAYLDLEALNG